MLGISTTTTTAALIAVKIGLCLSPFAACRLQFGFYLAILCCSVLVVVTVAIAVLFNYNYLFNHNFVRVSTIINHQMHHADSGRQNSVTGPTVSLTDWPLSAREQQAANSEQETGEGDGAAARPGQAVWNALHASVSVSASAFAACSSCLAQKVASASAAAERHNYLVSSQSVNRLVELATGAPAVAVQAV